MKKPIKPKPKQVANPVVVNVPSIQAEKMEVLRNLSLALVNITAALNTTATSVTIQHCHFFGTGGEQVLLAVR